MFYNVETSLGSILSIIALFVILYIPYYRLSLKYAVPKNYLLEKPRRCTIFYNYKTKYQYFCSIRLVEKICFSFILVFLQDSKAF